MLNLDSDMSLGGPGPSLSFLWFLLPVLPLVTIRPHEMMNPQTPSQRMAIQDKSWEQHPLCTVYRTMDGVRPVHSKHCPFRSHPGPSQLPGLPATWVFMILSWS